MGLSELIDGSAYGEGVCHGHRRPFTDL